MLRRRIEEKFLDWKQSRDKNPLIVKGCRQCGKTYSVLDFARKNYTNVVYINFFENPLYSQAFDSILSVDEIVMYLSAILGGEANFVPGDTCLILDEIQECPRARMALKFFKLDGRYDVICTGSLLGVSGYRDQSISVPVGYETMITMYPLDFEEFLWANGISEQIIDKLQYGLDTVSPISDVIHTKMNDLMHKYTIVGGMPAVVNEFIETKQLNKVLQLQRDIVNGYRDDMIKYASSRNKSQIRECFDSIPKQLAKENKKFQYSLVKKKGTAAMFSGSLQWIEDAGIIRRCYNLRITELPLDGNSDESVFKVYMSDIGLFVSMLEDGTQIDILQGSLLGYKGAIYENLVADFLTKAGRNLYFYRKDSGLEVDFVIRLNGECVLLECKASTGNVKSTKTILKHPEKYHVHRAIKLGNYNIGLSDNILTLPLYMGFLVAKCES